MCITLIKQCSAFCFPGSLFFKCIDINSTLFVIVKCIVFLTALLDSLFTSSVTWQLQLLVNFLFHSNFCMKHSVFGLCCHSLWLSGWGCRKRDLLLYLPQETIACYRYVWRLSELQHLHLLSSYVLWLIGSRTFLSKAREVPSDEQWGSWCFSSKLTSLPSLLCKGPLSDIHVKHVSLDLMGKSILKHALISCLFC